MALKHTAILYEYMFLLLHHSLAWLGLRWGAFTCVGWQATLCDPIW